MKDVMYLELYSETELIKTITLDIHEWYDGDILEIDSEEHRISHNILKIKGVQYNENGEKEQYWTNFYDLLGRIIKSEIYDGDLRIIEIEEMYYDEFGRMSTKKY